MTIYKLEQIVNSIRGNCTFQKKDLMNEGEYLALHYGKTYKIDFVCDDYNFYVNQDFFKKEQVVKKDDIVIVSTSETIEDLGHCYFYNKSEKNGLLGGEQILLKTSNLVESKWLFYWIKKNKKIFKKFATGLSVYRFKINDFKFIEIDLPTLSEQNKIIDIIEPIENLEFNILNMIEMLKKILINLYNFNDSIDSDSLSNFIKLINSKYENQKSYLATNAISEFGIDENKKINLDSNKKIPSRANVSPSKKSFIISKLSGENKIMFFNERPNEVFSTGFFNFETNYIDHLSGFILSSDFKEQKEMFSIGTTMRGINISSLEKIKIKMTTNASYELTEILVKLIELKQKMESLKNMKIKLLIK